MESCLSMFGSCDGSQDMFTQKIFEDTESPYPYSPAYPASKHQLIHDHKEAGNAAFQQDNFKTAISEYSKALYYFETGRYPTDEAVPLDDLEGSPTILLTNLLSNRAAAYTKLCEYEKALVDSRGIILYRPEWVKGYSRRGDAWYGLRQFQKALDQYQTALRLVPLNLM